MSFVTFNSSKRDGHVQLTLRRGTDGNPIRPLIPFCPRPLCLPLCIYAALISNIASFVRTFATCFFMKLLQSWTKYQARLRKDGQMLWGKYWATHKVNAKLLTILLWKEVFFGLSESIVFYPLSLLETVDKFSAKYSAWKAKCCNEKQRTKRGKAATQQRSSHLCVHLDGGWRRCCYF